MCMNAMMTAVIVVSIPEQPCINLLELAVQMKQLKLVGTNKILQLNI